MDCPRASELLVDYLYQELDATLIEPFEAHVASCPRCAEQLKVFQATRAAAQSLPELEPPVRITQGLIAAAAQELNPKTGLWDYLGRSLRFTVMHPAMTAAVTLVVVVGISIYAYRQSAPPTAPIPKPLLPEVVHQPAGPTAQSGEEPPAREAEGTLQLGEEEDSTASIAARKSPQPAPARAAPRKVEYKVPVAQARPAAAPPPQKAAAAAKSSSKSGDTDALQAARRSPLKATRRKRRPRLSPNTLERGLKHKPAVEGEAGNVKQHLALGHAAAAKQRCFQALKYYNKVLELQPKLKRSLQQRIQRCVGVLGRAGEVPLLKAQQEFPTLSGFVERELARRRRPSRGQKKAKTTPRKAKNGGQKKARTTPRKAKNGGQKKARTTPRKAKKKAPDVGY